MLLCVSCGCVSDDAPGWVALLVDDPDGVEEPSVVIVCPPCAADGLGYESRVRYT